MNTTVFQMLFVACAFLSQILLIFNFATFKWKPRIQQKWGWIIYAALYTLSTMLNVSTHFKPKAPVTR